MSFWRRSGWEARVINPEVISLIESGLTFRTAELPISGSDPVFEVRVGVWVAKASRRGKPKPSERLG